MTTTPPLADVPIRSADELTQRWAELLEPPIFGARSLWLRQVHDGVTDAHLDGEGHLAMALCRPGRSEITVSDDEWAEEFRAMFDDGQIDGTWSLHLAAGGTVVPLVNPPA